MLESQNRPIEPAHDLFRIDRGPLDVFVRPRNIAILGATETPASVGRTLVENAIGSRFESKTHFVNPKRDSVFGRPCHRSLADIGSAVDLAVIAIPARHVPDAIGQCLQVGARGAIVISAGFKEIGEEGTLLEQQIREQIAGTSLRVIGPNCLGVMSPVTGLNATFAASMAAPGRVAFISQSGALLTSILDWSLAENVGFSHIVSTGSMLDVGWGDLIDFLGDDPDTSSIVIYMESIGDAAAFMSAAREVALQKPIIVIKSGRSQLAAKAASSHTGALAGSDEVLDAAFRRAGVVRVHRISDLFNLAEVLSKQPRPRGPRLAIVTNAGGPGVLATDALDEAGGQLAVLSDETLARLDQHLPPHWSHANPIDVLGDAGPERFAECVEIATSADECDGLLAILTPQAMTDPAQTAREVARQAGLVDKPILASWMGAAQVAGGIQSLNQAGVPTFTYPDSAARAFQYMWRYSEALHALYETPSLHGNEVAEAQRAAVGQLLRNVLDDGRVLLTEAESKQLLAAYGIPTVETHVAASADEAVQWARQIGYPVVVKLNSTTITHKTDVGGVRLNLQNDDEVRKTFDEIAARVEDAAGSGHFQGVTVQPMIAIDGYELIIGSKVDPQFGPVILFGLGGQMVEVFRDRALGLPPLNSTLARRMMERTKIFTALKGVRGRPPVDLSALERLLVRFAELVVEQPRISEIDINPLLVSHDAQIALDARVVLHEASIAESDLPKAVIRSYPREYMTKWADRAGRELLIRPVRPEDEPMFVEFHASLSEHTVYERYARMMSLDQRTTHDRLSRMCFIDYDRQIALLAIDEQGAKGRIAGVARIIRLHNSAHAEFAVVVSDADQRRGLGTKLLSHAIHVAQRENIDRLVCQINANNRAMLAMCRRFGFQFESPPGDPALLATLDLNASS